MVRWRWLFENESFLSGSYDAMALWGTDGVISLSLLRTLVSHRPFDPSASLTLPHGISHLGFDVLREMLACGGSASQLLFALFDCSHSKAVTSPCVSAVVAMQWKVSAGSQCIGLSAGHLTGSQRPWDMQHLYPAGRGVSRLKTAHLPWIPMLLQPLAETGTGPSAGCY